ncbi:AAA family ATPase [Streptomyces sp. NPDC002588]|uniref:helix-turn-helix transcriptional regulator n=1 Tax=Streptomyces sp. NPDC002588 TaxID=3154419 RepID=UPI003321D3BD
MRGKHRSPPGPRHDAGFGAAMPKWREPGHGASAGAAAQVGQAPGGGRLARRPSRNDRTGRTGRTDRNEPHGEPRRRPASAHGSGEPAGHAHPAPDFIGREDELSALLDAFENGPALVVIEGEAGIGKTRLIREAVASVSGRSALIATCPPLPEPFTLGAVVDGIRRLCPRLGAELELSPLAGALRPLFPDWADRLPPALEGLDDPKETRHRILSALTELVSRLGIGVLVVEDAHWADTATLEWLLTLTAAGRTDLSIVVSFRPDEVASGSLLPRLTSRVPSDVSLLRLGLGPLDLTDTRELIASMFDSSEVSAEFVSFLHKHTDGIPLAVEECVLLLRDREDIVHRDGTWIRRVLSELQVPATLRDSVLERVERLDDGARRVLEAAAVLDAPSEEALLTEVAGLGAEAGRKGLAAALRSGLLRESAPGAYAYRHALDCVAVCEAIPASDRRHLHGRAAASLRSMRPEPVARLFRHCREAGDVDGWCRYGEASADVALESGDDRAAVVTLLSLLGAEDLATADRSRLVRKMGGAAVFGARDVSDLARSVVGAVRGVLSYDDLPRPERGEIQLLLGRLLRDIGEDSAAFEEIEDGVGDLLDRPDLAAPAMSVLAMPMVPDWPAARHLAWLDRATALLPRIESSSDRLRVTTNRAAALLLLGEEAGWQAADEIRESAAGAAASERRLLARFLFNMGQIAILWGRYGEARARLTAAAELAEATGYRRLLSTVRVPFTYLDWCTGRWAGLDATVAALAADRNTSLYSSRLATQIHAVLALAVGDRAAARRGLRKVVDELAEDGLCEPEVGLSAAALGRLHAADADWDEAQHVTGRVLELIERKGVWLWATDVLPPHLDALVGSGRLDEAGRLLRRYADGIDGRDAPAAVAALSLGRAVVAQGQGDLDGAAEMFAEAASAWAALPRPYDEMLALERQGRCLLGHGDAERALALLGTVQERLWALGARTDADRVALLLREHGREVARAWRRGPRGYGAQLSPRERQVVALVAQGMTNRAAAQALFVSPKTVATQLSAAMRKLGVSSRAAVVRVAVETGVLPPATDDSGPRG